MSTNTRVQDLWQTVKAIPHNVIQFISGAIVRIFGVSDDDYPETGVQPFEGEPAKDKYF
ncbi:MAG: hypothetical protein MUC48_04500 [Leptolyngbya sp. Prado105]|jgi:hypothetical protein|nr:hypothetical protein [Leptolyngbya sp. Prado105]